MTCVACAGGANPMTSQANMLNQAGPTAAGAGGQANDLMTKVMDILRKMGLDNGQETGAMSKDDLARLFKALQQMGPAGMKQVLQQNPQLTKMLGQALGQAPGQTAAV